jgi:hypothetical protein
MDENSLIRKPKKLKLYNALNIGYLRNEKKQAKRLKKFGYVLDKELTNREHLVAYNPFDQKLLYVSNGTNFANPTDVYNDIRGLTNTQKSSRRYQEEKNALLKAKEKYDEKKVTLVSHSLGSQYTNTIASRNDNVIQYNPFLMPNTTPRDNIQNIRTEYDPVSIFAPSQNTKTLPAGNGNGLLKAHNLDNIRNQPIFL